MSKKIEDSELQTLTLSPTNTNEDESSLFINPASDETAFPVSPPPPFPNVVTSSSAAPGEKRPLERMSSMPLTNPKVLPTLRVSTPPGNSRISYTNERTNDRKIDFSKISRDRPTPGSALNQKKDALRSSEKSRPTGLVLSIGGAVGKGLPSGKSSFKRSEVENISRPSATSHSLKGSLRKAVENKDSNPSSFRGQWIAMPTYQSRVGTPKGWMGRAGLQSGFRLREGIDSRQMDRPTQHHTFLTDVADVRQIEQGLLQLMEDFQAGNLRAFGKDSRLRQMEAIREQQERLARLHFDVGAEQDLYPPLSEDSLRTSHDNMRTLMEKLAQLSESIERLHTNTSCDRKTSSNERKPSMHQMHSSGQLPFHRPTEHVNHVNIRAGCANQQNETLTSRTNDSQNVFIPMSNANLSNANVNSPVTNTTNQHVSPGNTTNQHVSPGNTTNQHVSPGNTNVLQSQHNLNSTNRSRTSGGYQSAVKNGKVADS